MTCECCDREATHEYDAVVRVGSRVMVGPTRRALVCDVCAADLRAADPDWPAKLRPLGKDA